MDKFEIDNSLESSFSDDSLLESFESSGDAFDAMDSVEVPVIEEVSFDNVESGNIEGYLYDNTEHLNTEVNDIMNEVKVEELAFDEDIEQIDNIPLDLESQIKNATSVEELRQIRNQILQKGLPKQDISGDKEFTAEEYVEDSPKILTRKITPEIIESRNADTEEVLDDYRENLRKYGVDEDSIEQFVSQERDKINAEYESLDRGDLNPSYYESPIDWKGVASRLKKVD